MGGESVVMRLAIVLALVAIGASPRHGGPEGITSDTVMQHLDLASFGNRGVRWAEDGKHTFADNGFVVVRKSAVSATLIRKSDGLTKSFDILIDDKHSLRLCFHDKWVVMPHSPAPMRFDYTTALFIWRAEGRLWKAEINPGGFVGCVNNPPVERDLSPPPSQPSSPMTSLINAIAPRGHYPQP